MAVPIKDDTIEHNHMIEKYKLTGSITIDEPDGIHTEEYH